MATAYHAKADLATAAEVAQEALAAAERTGDAFDLLSAHYQAGIPLFYQGHFSRTLQHFEHGSGIRAPWILCRLAEALRKVGRHDDALITLARGVAQAEQPGQHCHDAELHRLRPRFSST